MSLSPAEDGPRERSASQAGCRVDRIVYRTGSTKEGAAGELTTVARSGSCAQSALSAGHP
jgi:hypothetical protein